MSDWKSVTLCHTNLSQPVTNPLLVIANIPQDDKPCRRLMSKAQSSRSILMVVQLKTMHAHILKHATGTRKDYEWNK